MKNKKGEVIYIYLCVLILVIAMLLSVLILYMGLTAQVQIQKRDMQAKLDGYVSEYAIEVYDAIKQGNSYEECIDYDALKNNCSSAIGFNMSGEYIYGNGNCTLTSPNATILKGEGFGIVLTYNAVFPIEWNGKVYTDLTIPITVRSYFKFK